MLIPVELASFALDPDKGSPLIILKEIGGQRSVALPIGPLEASAIAIQSLDVKAEKPLTIDLATLIMEQLGGTLKRAVVYDIADQTFLARIQIMASASIYLIECRPCDAIAMALRCDAPVFIHEQVFEKTKIDETVPESELLRRHISALDTIELGRIFLE